MSKKAIVAAGVAAMVLLGGCGSSSDEQGMTTVDEMRTVYVDATCDVEAANATASAQWDRFVRSDKMSKALPKSFGTAYEGLATAQHDYAAAMLDDKWVTTRLKVYTDSLGRYALVEEETALKTAGAKTSADAFAVDGQSARVVDRRNGTDLELRYWLGIGAGEDICE